MAAASPGDSSHHLLDLQGEDAALGPSVPDVSGGEALAVDTAPPPMWTRDCALPFGPQSLFAQRCLLNRVTCSPLCRAALCEGGTDVAIASRYAPITVAVPNSEVSHSTFFTPCASRLRATTHRTDRSSRHTMRLEFRERFMNVFCTRLVHQQLGHIQRLWLISFCSGAHVWHFPPQQYLLHRDAIVRRSPRKVRARRRRPRYELQTQTYAHKCGTHVLST